jgi:hypothetical protein
MDDLRIGSRFDYEEFSGYFRASVCDKSPKEGVGGVTAVTRVRRIYSPPDGA